MKIKIGLALSGGGARGFAHIGVLKVFTRNKINIDCISGTSLGGIIAAAYASGYSINEIEERAIKLSRLKELMKLIDLTPGRRGLISSENVSLYLRNMFPEGCCFEQTNIPLALNAVDLIKGQDITFTHGDLLPALMASCAVPGIFPPVNYQGRKLVDGGVLNNIPVKQLFDLGADIKIAINAQIDPENEHEEDDIPLRINLPLPDYLRDLYWSGYVMVSKLSRFQLEQYQPDLYIDTHVPANIDMFFGFTKAEEIIRAGEEETQKALPKILSLLNRAD